MDAAHSARTCGGNDKARPCGLSPRRVASQMRQESGRPGCVLMVRNWESVERDGWRLFFAAGQRYAAELANAQVVDDPELVGKTNADLVEQALAAACGRLGRPLRRSRYALTWVVQNGGDADGATFSTGFGLPRRPPKAKRTLQHDRQGQSER